MGNRDHAKTRRSLSLDRLEGITSPWPRPEDSSLVTQCLRLRRVPIGDFTPGDLRIMIGQSEGLMFLVPLAVEHLKADPLVEASYYPGDLLCAVLGAGQEFWQRHPELRVRVDEILGVLGSPPPRIAQAVAAYQASRTT